MKIEFWWRESFEILIIHKPSLFQNLGPIGSAVLTFIGYKQTNRQANYIDINEIIDKKTKVIYFKVYILLESWDSRLF